MDGGAVCWEKNRIPRTTYDTYYHESTACYILFLNCRLLLPNNIIIIISKITEHTTDIMLKSCY